MCRQLTLIGQNVSARSHEEADYGHETQTGATRCKSDSEARASGGLGTSGQLLDQLPMISPATEPSDFADAC